MDTKLMGAGLLALATASAALAEGGPQALGNPATDSSSVQASSSGQETAGKKGRNTESIVITGRRLDIARDSITPSLGASQYTFDREALQKQPGGTNLTLNKSLLQAPGVVQDSYGIIHVRNEHANLQYRLNGVIVPESITGFGTTFDPRIASAIQLITGTLPAQYGYRTAGVVNFKTQSGLLQSGGEVGIYGGTFGWLEPSAMVQGSSGNLSYFVSASYFRNNLGIENPESTNHAIRDRTTQFRPFAYVSDILSDTSRISVFGGSFIGHFQIPNVRDSAPLFTVNGVSNFDSAKLDQNQREITHYGVVAYQYAGENLNFQIAPFIRYSQTLFTPDPNLGDMIFNGYADRARLSSLASGVQTDSSLAVGSNHTIRFGLFFQNEHTTSDVTSTVLPVDAFGNPTSDIPLTIIDRHRKTGQLYGAYLQDEWKLTSRLTLNYGARYDIVRAYTRESQLSPRDNLVWQPAPLTTVHLGYARTFTPPPQELIAPADVALYDGTTKKSGPGDTVKSERENYFDAGIEQRFNGG
ncbi:MAG TPA: TonB-dependent receptor, partial [Sphingomicrobium sp.]|nr:TonB-dependent receptor [Sphingomicrobium sp.]